MHRPDIRPLSSWLIALLLLTTLFAACGDDDPKEPTPTPTSTSTTTTETTPIEDVSGEDTAEDVTEDVTPDVDPDTPDAEVDPIGPPPEHVREERPMAQGPLRASVAKGYLDGPVGISMAGYGGRSGRKTAWAGLLKGSSGFYGLMTVKAMVLEVDGEQLALIKLPTMSSENSITEGIAQKLLDEHGIDMRGRILTGATHSHHTHARYWRIPDDLGVIGIDSSDEEMISIMIDVFADTVKRAIDTLEPAEWGYAYQDDWDVENRIYRDRRSENNPLYPKDPRLSLLAVRKLDDTPLGVIINFGMHGTLFGGDNDLLTEDAPGGLELKFEEYFYQREDDPIFGLFIQSGGGDASPAGDDLNHDNPAKAELIGERAAPKIYDLYKTIEFSSEATLSVRSRRIDIRYSWMGYDEYLEFLDPLGEPYTWGGWQCKNANNDTESMEGRPKQCFPVELLLSSFGESAPHPELHQMYLTTARIGNLFLVTIPGEPAYSVIKYLRDQVAELSTDETPIDVMAFGYSQDHLLYFTHPDDWFLGGYESEMSLFGPLAGKYVIDRQMQFVNDMLEGFNGPTFYEESPNTNQPKPFTPRTLEGSIDPGTIIEQPAATVQRTQTIVFGFNAGDPALPSPHVTVQVQDPSDDSWSNVPSPTGLPNESLDNRRYHMITHYQPIPEPSEELLDERQHRWFIQWQVPTDFPAGNYRLAAHTHTWDGSARQEDTLTSDPFTIERSAQTTLTTEWSGETLRLDLKHAPVPTVESSIGNWPASGWRLLDTQVAPTEEITVYAPIVVNFVVEGTPQDETYPATFDLDSGAYTLNLTDIPLPQDASIVVRVHHASDRVPSWISNAQ